MSQSTNKQKNYFVIGGGSLQKDFIELVKSKGFKTHVFDYNPDCVCASIADAFHCISIDEKEKILEVATKYKPIAIQTVATELGNITASYVGEKLGLRNCTFQTALNTTDKYLMKQVFRKFLIPTASYQKITSIDQIDIKGLSYPVIVKASDRSAGRGVSMARTSDEFNLAFREAQDESINKIVLVEEYLQGQQFSVESISYNGMHRIVAITEEYTTGAPDFIECYHLIPARLSKNLEKKIEEFAQKVLNAFNIEWGASHIELINTKTGIKIIEIASRMGGFRDKMISISKGVNYLDLILKSSLGIEPVFSIQKHDYAIVKMILDKEDFSEYKRIKESKNNILAMDAVNEKTSFNKKARTLIDAQGFYYLHLTNKHDIKKYLK